MAKTLLCWQCAEQIEDYSGFLTCWSKLCNRLHLHGRHAQIRQTGRTCFWYFQAKRGPDHLCSAGPDKVIHSSDVIIFFSQLQADCQLSSQSQGNNKRSMFLLEGTDKPEPRKQQEKYVLIGRNCPTIAKETVAKINLLWLKETVQREPGKQLLK